MVTGLPFDIRESPLLTVTEPVPSVVRAIDPLAMTLLLIVIDPLPAVVCKLKLEAAIADVVVLVLEFRNTVPPEARLMF